MCGINGIFAYHYAANPIDRAELLRTREHMTKRGPDAAGEWISDDCRIGLGHRRLSIIDLSATGAQPMRSNDGRFIATFNGEIYNYQEIRRALELKGREFRSRSDTEVLLHLYALNGAEMVNELRGMFAFAIWDSAERELFLARDPYGVKPLYFADDGWTFRFASQVKALLAGGGAPLDPDPAGEIGFYIFGHVPEPFTLYRSISALPAGSALRVGPAGPGAPARYHSIARLYREAEGRPHANGPTQAFREAALDSVRHHLIADVPVGAFLSAGVDSSALVGLMRDAGQQDIETVTLAFAEFAGAPQDEAPLAEAVAKTYATRHTTRRVDRAEFEADLPAILEAMDQPTIDGVNAWFVAKAAHELGLKVAISGVGGDELLGGYPAFRDVPRWVRRMRWLAWTPLLGRLTRLAGRPLFQALGVNPKAAGVLEYGGDYPGAYLLKRALFMPWELGGLLPREVLTEGLARLAPLDLIARELDPVPARADARVATLESALYLRSRLLRDTDWASMAHSVEVRTPLVDATLLQRSAGIAASLGALPSKAMLAAAPSRPLPEAILRRAKTGFATPLASWQSQGSLGARVGVARPAGEPWARAWASMALHGSRAEPIAT